MITVKQPFDADRYVQPADGVVVAGRRVRRAVAAKATPLHDAADALVPKFSVALRYAFAEGRRAIRAQLRAAEWNEALHPRDGIGRFTDSAVPHEQTRDEFYTSNTQLGPGYSSTAEGERIDALPNDAELWVYHATDPATAKQFAANGINPTEKPPNLARDSYERGDDATFAPGRGLAAGLTVAATPQGASGYGRQLIAIRIRKGDLQVPPEQEVLGVKTGGLALASEDAQVSRVIPASDIVLIGERGYEPGSAHEEFIKQAIRDGKTVPGRVLDDYPQLRKMRELAGNDVADRAATAVSAALRRVLPGLVSDALAAGGDVAMGQLALRDLAYNPDQPRDEIGRWTDSTGAVVDLPVYRGGIPSPDEAVTYYTTDRAMAESYVEMSNDRFGEGGVLQEARITISNPAPTHLVSGTASVIGIENADYTPASVFDPNLHGKALVDKLVNILIDEGYDGAVLTDIAYGRQIEAPAYIVFNKAKLRGLAGIKRKVKPQLKSRITFSRVDKSAVSWARKHSAELITDIAETTRKRIQSVIARKLEGEIDNKTATSLISRAIGDDDRALLIARHETMTAVSEGQRLAWHQALDRGLLSDTGRTWIETPDGKLCPVCEGLAGTTAPLDGQYEGGITGPPAHVGCRCTEGLAP